MAASQPPRETIPSTRIAGFASERDLVLPLAAAIGVILGWIIFLDYEQIVVDVAGQAPVLAQRVWGLRLMMVLASAGVLGLAWLTSRDAKRRRCIERELERLNAELSHRVVRRTAMLQARTKALREAQLRERLREREAELAFQAGQVEAAGAYLHTVGNALSSLELELLRLAKVGEGVQRLESAFAGLAGHIESGRTEEAARVAEALRQAVLERTFPRLADAQTALADIKGRMADELERRRGAFERRGQPVHYFQSFRLDLELAAMLDRLPRATGSDPVVRDIDCPIAITNRKHSFLTGLASLLRQTLDLAPGPVAVRLRQEVGNRAVITVEGAGEEAAREPAVADFIDFLNENGGSFRFEAALSGHPARLEVAIGDAPSAAALP